MQWILHRLTALSGAAEPCDDFGEEADDDWDMALEGLEAEGGWLTYTPSLEKSSPQRSPRHHLFHHCLYHLRVIRSSPPPPRKVEFGTAITDSE